MAEKDATARLRRAVKENNLFLVKRLIQRTEMRNPDPTTRRFTSLAWAAVLGHEETFEFLLTAGHDDEELSRDAENNTILMLLSDLKPSCSTSPYLGRPPDVDVIGAALRMSRMYYDRYTWILDWSNVQGKTALHIAALKGNEELVRMLCDLGADFNLSDNKGNTPLHYASSWGHIHVVQLLIERGCQYTARNNDGFTASDYAYSFSTRDTLQDTARIQFENNKKSRRNIFAQAAARGNEWGGLAPPPPPQPPFTKSLRDVHDGTMRMRSGSGGSRTTATSDSGDLDGANLTTLGQSILSTSSSQSHPSYSNASSHANMYPSSSSGNMSSVTSTTTFSASSPGPPQPPPLPNPAAALSPIATRMRERDADAMEKYMRRNRSGSASTDTKSQTGSIFSSAGPSANGDDITSLASLPPSGASTPRKKLRPSLSAAQLRAHTLTPSIITTSVTPPDTFRSRAGTNPTATRPNPASLSPPPILKRSTSTSDSRHDRMLVEEPEEEPQDFFGAPDSVQLARVLEPSQEPHNVTPTARRLPFHLLSKTFLHTDHQPAVTAGGHRRGGSATSMR